MQLQDVFVQLCRDAAVRKDVLHTEVIEEKRMTCFSIYFRVIRVDLIYSRKWETVAPPSVLYARFYLNKNTPLYLHLPELIAYLNMQDFRACYFPCIESPKRLRDCFSTLMEIVDDYIPLAEELCMSGQDRVIMEHWAAEGFFEDPKAKPEDPDGEIDWDTMQFVQKLQESVMVFRHTDLQAYRAFLSGDRAKAAIMYEKLRKNGLSLYEKNLLTFLHSDKSDGFVPIPPHCHSAWEYKKGENGDRFDLMGLALVYGLFSCVFCGLLAIINAVLSYGALYFYGVEWWYGFLLALLPALFGYFAFQRPIRQKLGGKNSYLEIQKSAKFTQRLSTVFFAAAVLACIWFCVAVPPMSSRYYNTYGIHYSENETFERFAYTQVREVCFIQARYNVYGDRVERASYVLILEDGRQIDLDGDGSVQEQLTIIRRLLPNVSIRQLDSDRELPYYTAP